MSSYDLRAMTFGAELEVGDVYRGTPIPPHLGKWAMTETDVMNFKTVVAACDPLGEDPPWGGEVNLAPSRSPREAAEKMEGVISHLRSQPGNDPSYTSMNASHVHVRVPGLRDDIDALKRLVDYVVNSQDEFLARTYMKDYIPPKWTPETKKFHTIPLDGNRKMQPWMRDNILKFATDFDSFIDMHTRGKDAKVRYRMFRYSVNTYNLRFMDTVEFRWFRATLDPRLWSQMFHFCERFMHEALGPQTPIGEWLDLFEYPPFIPHDVELMKVWEKTRYTQSRFAHLPRRSLVEV